MLEKLRGDLAKLKDWRVALLLLLAVPVLWYILGNAIKVAIGAFAVVGIAGALALLYRKFLLPDMSGHADNAKGSPIGSAIVVLAGMLVICSVILAVAHLAKS